MRLQISDGNDANAMKYIQFIYFLFYNSITSFVLFYRRCDNGSPCAGSEQIIYAWAKNADPLVLPKRMFFLLFL